MDPVLKQLFEELAEAFEEKQKVKSHPSPRQR
jgi:hypothetical protein